MTETSRQRWPGEHSGAESRIFKIVSSAEWAVASDTGAFTGSAVDGRDGFIHLSTAAQVKETAARHFSGQRDLVLVEVDAAAVQLRWERSRGGQLFPHLYGPLPLTAVIAVCALPLSPDGVHEFPPLS